MINMIDYLLFIKIIISTVSDEHQRTTVQFDRQVPERLREKKRKWGEALVSQRHWWERVAGRGIAVACRGTGGGTSPERDDENLFFLLWRFPDSSWWLMMVNDS